MVIGQDLSKNETHVVAALNTCTTFSVELRASNTSRFFVIDRLICVASLRRRDYPGLLESQLEIVSCKGKPMVGREGEFHRHVLAILSSHPLQLLRVLDVHRLEEQRRNVRFFFSHKISWEGDWDSWKQNLHHLQLHLLYVSRTSLRHLVVFVRLLVSCQKYVLQRPYLVNVNLCGAVY